MAGLIIVQLLIVTMLVMVGAGNLRLTTEVVGTFTIKPVTLGLATIGPVTVGPISVGQVMVALFLLWLVVGVNTLVGLREQRAKRKDR